MGTVTLSFDNGPDPETTPRVLDVLARRRVRATFFVLGSNLIHRDRFRIAQRAVAENHWIGNHSFSHKIPLGEDVRADAIDREISQTERLIGTLARTPKLFRPFGHGGKIGPHLLSKAARDYLVSKRYTCVLWNSVPEDWLHPDSWVERALAHCDSHKSTMVVLHDIHGPAMRHLDRFIESLVDAGHEIKQDLPTDCLPIVGGVAGRGISAIVSRSPSPAH